MHNAAVAAATAAADLLPSTGPVEARRGHRPPPAGAAAVTGTWVGDPGAEIAVVADGAIAEAVTAAAQNGDPVEITDLLRPALEAAGHVLGPGVLQCLRLTTAGEVSEDATVVELVRDGVVVMWFLLRAHTPLADTAQAPAGRDRMQVLYDVEMTLTAEIGRARMPVRDVLELAPGRVLELDRAAGSPADVRVNGRLVARGEVVVVDEDYGVRITEILGGPDVAQR